MLEITIANADAALSIFKGCSNAIAIYPRTKIIIINVVIVIFYLFKYTVVVGKAKSDL